MLSFYLFYFALLLLYGLVCFHLHCSAKTSCRLRRLLKYNALCHSANSDKTKIRLPYFIFICLFKINQPPENPVWVFFFLCCCCFSTAHQQWKTTEPKPVWGLWHFPCSVIPCRHQNKSIGKGSFVHTKDEKNTNRAVFFLFVIKRNKKRHQDWINRPKRFFLLVCLFVFLETQFLTLIFWMEWVKRKRVSLVDDTGSRSR